MNQELDWIGFRPLGYASRTLTAEEIHKYLNPTEFFLFFFVLPTYKNINRGGSVELGELGHRVITVVLSSITSD